jgi:4-hydroxybenzoate polyprenyltransferase
MTTLRALTILCRMVKIEHSVFALPFAYAGAFLAARGLPEAGTLLALTLAMVGVRSFAMAVNRLADLPFDRKNPRTADRPLVVGDITPRQAWLFAAGMALVFVLCCAALNMACLALSPLALIGAALYSYTKRLTWLCHFALGAVIGLAPIAGWLAVSPHAAVVPLLLGFGVLFWLAGFDILYACQDVEFDSAEGLHSVPVHFGLAGAMTIAAFCHVNMLIFLFLAGFARNLGFGWYFALALAGVILWWEHSLVAPDRLEDIRFAFSLNAPISLLLLFGVVMGVLF